MPLEGFDDASKNISKRGSSRRKAKASRDAYFKRIAAEGATKKAKKAKKKAAQSEFNKYATPGQKRKAARNSSVNKADVIAKGKATEAAKAKAKIKANTGDSNKLINAPGTYNTPDKIKVENIKPQKTSKVTGAIGSETRRKQYDALNYKYDDTISVKPKAKKPAAKAKAPAAKAPKMANTGFTSAADRIKNKGVSNLKPTPSKTKKGSYNFNEGTGPNTSVFDKTKNVAPKTEEKAKRKKRAAKGSRAATLKKGFGY